MSKENLIKKIFWYFLISATLIQAVFAFIWIKGNASTYFEEMLSNNYIEAAKTIKVNDYMGIAYALFVKLLGHGFVLYLVQLLFVFFSATLFADTFVSDFRKWIVGLYIVSNPFILQSCFKVLPGAVTVALSLLALYAIRKDKVAVFLVADIMLGFMNSDYAYLILLIMLPVAIYKCIKKKDKAWHLFGSIIAAAVLCIVVNRLVTDSYAYGAVKKTVPFLCMQRIVQGHLSEYENVISSFYGIDLSGEMVMADRVSELVIYDFASAMDANFSGYAQDIYKYFTKMALKKGLRSFGVEVIRDFLYYLGAPFSVAFIWETGKTETLLANPLHDFIKAQGSISKVYFMFSINVVSILILVSMIALLIYLINHEKTFNEISRFLISRGYLYLIIWVALYSTFICIRGFDYRNCLVSIIAWPLMTISAFGNRREE